MRRWTPDCLQSSIHRDSVLTRRSLRNRDLPRPGPGIDIMQRMYSATLALHSWLRWAVILLAVLALVRAFAAARSGRWTPADNRAAMLFTMMLDVQFLVGLLLYFLVSPITKTALQHMDAAMRSSGLRYFAVEHPTAMLIALVLAHVGRARVRRAPEAKKGRMALIFFAIALLVILGMTPWPNTSAGRPLFRLPGS
jgi:hypothetical protein